MPQTKNPEAPWLAFKCSHCSAYFIGQGLNLTLCTVCSKGRLTSVPPSALPSEIASAQTSCTICGLIHTSSQQHFICETPIASHDWQPLAMPARDYLRRANTKQESVN